MLPRDLVEEGKKAKRKRVAHLENLFRIRPAGVTSKKDIGDLKMAVAILSCNFREAYRVITREQAVRSSASSHRTYLDRAEDPKNQRLHNRERGGADADCQVDANVFANLGVGAFLVVSSGPVLQPIASS